jgi:hypothetical protein
MDLHNFWNPDPHPHQTKFDPDPHPIPYQSDELDPDPHQSDKSDPEPHQSDADPQHWMCMYIRVIKDVLDVLL